VYAALGGVKVERNNDTGEAAREAMNAALSLYPESFSDYCKDLSSTDNAIAAVHNARDRGNEMQNPEGDNPTSLSALENEIYLLESQITGLEQQDQSSVVQYDEVIEDSHRFGPPVLPSERASIEKTFDVKRLFESPVPSQELPQIAVKASRKMTSDNQHSKPPLIPSDHAAAPTEATIKLSKSLDSKPRSKSQHKSTDATLVTAPTVMTMDTPFTMETPLVLSPAAKVQRKWDRNSSMLVATAIALPSEMITGDQVEETTSPFFLVFIVGTQKHFSHLLFIAIAWLRHLSSMGFRQQQHDRMQVGLMVPPIVDDDVLQEQQLQIGPSVVCEMQSAASEEPGIVVESFVPEMLSGNESAGRERKKVFSTNANNSIWNKLFRKEEIEAATSWGAEV